MPRRSTKREIDYIIYAFIDNNSEDTRMTIRRLFAGSRNLNYRFLLRGLRRGLVPNDSGVVESKEVQQFRWLNFTKQDTHYYIGLCSPSSDLLYSDPKLMTMNDPE